MKTFLIVVICCLLFFLTGCTFISKKNTALKPPLIKPVKQDYTIEPVIRGTITKEVTNNAIFISSKRENLSFKSSGGRLKSIDVKIGDNVKKGDVLAQLESEELERQLYVQKRMLEKTTIAYTQSEMLNSGNETLLQLQKIDVELARTEMNRLNDLLLQTKLIATIDGKVTELSVREQGDYMTAYETIVSISDPQYEQLWSTFDSPVLIEDVRVGMSVDINMTEGDFKGHVLQAPSSVPVTASMDQIGKASNILIIGLDDVPPGDYLESSATIVITLAKKENTLIIPDSAITTFLGRKYVYTLDGENRRQIDVETGIKFNNKIQITKGLKEGQQVIVD